MTDIFNTVTVQQFKEYFFRDFSFLPLYVEGQTYWSGDIVYYLTPSLTLPAGEGMQDAGNFYQSLTDNNTSLPTDTENWKPIKASIYDYVTDSDIERAMSQAYLNRNYRFGSTDEERINIYLHLIAFYLVMDMQNASAGVGSGYMGLVASRSVDGVSESYNFPQWLLNSPVYGIFASNGFGMKYLSLILPYICCPILFSPGRTTYG